MFVLAYSVKGSLTSWKGCPSVMAFTSAYGEGHGKQGLRSGTGFYKKKAIY